MWLKWSLFSQLTSACDAPRSVRSVVIWGRNSTEKQNKMIRITKTWKTSQNEKTLFDVKSSGNVEEATFPKGNKITRKMMNKLQAPHSQWKGFFPFWCKILRWSCNYRPQNTVVYKSIFPCERIWFWCFHLHPRCQQYCVVAES